MSAEVSPIKDYSIDLYIKSRNLKTVYFTKLCLPVFGQKHFSYDVIRIAFYM